MKLSRKHLDTIRHALRLWEREIEYDMADMQSVAERLLDSEGRRFARRDFTAAHKNLTRIRNVLLEMGELERHCTPRAKGQGQHGKEREMR